MRDLTPLFEPRSVALVGASNDRMKWGGWFAISLLGQHGAPPVHMVSRRGGEVFGQQAVDHVSTRSTPRRSSARATISRWISLVPSQMRSTRSSRQNRSATLVRV